MGDAVRLREGMARFGFFRQIQAIAFDVGIGGVEQGQVVFIAPGQVLRQVRLEASIKMWSLAEELQPTQQGQYDDDD